MQADTSVKVAVRIRPLSGDESANDETKCVEVVPGENQVTLSPVCYTSRILLKSCDLGRSRI